MPVLSVTTLIDAPARTVAGVLRDVDAIRAALRRCGHDLESSARLLSVGDDLRPIPGVRARVTAVSVRGYAAQGPGFAHTTSLTSTAAGTRVVDEIRWTVAGLAPEVVRRLLAARSTELARRAVAWAAAPVVVATALVRDGAVLAAQRTRPPALAGRWELPGGRVEPGESEPDAVVRECREELGTTVVPCGRLGTDLPIEVGVLRVHRAVPAPGAPEPRALEHSGLRWVTADEVAAVDWVDADRAVVADLVGLLRSLDDDGGPRAVIIEPERGGG